MRTLGSLILPAQIYWLDRDWSPVAQRVYPLLGGTQRITENAISGYRPITLGGDACWWTWAEKEALIALANTAGAQLPFVFDGYKDTAMFRRDNGAPYEFTPLMGYDDPTADQYTGTVRLYGLRG